MQPSSMQAGSRMRKGIWNLLDSEGAEGGQEGAEAGPLLVEPDPIQHDHDKEHGDEDHDEDHMSWDQEEDEDLQP